jgi:hypothetical protein
MTYKGFPARERGTLAAHSLHVYYKFHSSHYLWNWSFRVLALVAGLWCARVSAQSTATLAWDSDTDSTVAGYRVYSGTESGVYTEMDDVGNTTAASMSGLQPGVTYYVTIAAYDSTGDESPPSGEVTVTGTVTTTTTGTTTGTTTTTGTESGPVAPSAPNQTVLVLATTPVVIDVLAAAGESGSSETISQVSQPTYGGAAANGDGTITYTPGIDFTGHDSFKYTVTSGTLAATGTISLSNRGNFNGLVTNASPAAGNMGGLQLSLGPGGRFTGRLTAGAISSGFRGVFDANGQATVTIQPSGQAATTLSLSLDAATGGVSGTMSTATGSSAISAGIETYSPANKAPEAGSYTVLMPPDPNATGTEAPQGIGYFRLVVETNGMAYLAGILADSTVISLAAPVREDGSVSFYKGLYGNQGYLSGVLRFESITTSGSESDLDGAIQWQRPQNNRSKMYPGGFATGIAAIGSTYVPPTQSPVTADVLTTEQKRATVNVSFAGSDLATTVDDEATVVAPNLLEEKNAGKNTLTVAINPRTGLFIGSFLDPVTNKVGRLGGAVFQARAIGAGSFYGKSSSGSVMLANGGTGNP